MHTARGRVLEGPRGRMVAASVQDTASIIPGSAQAFLWIQRLYLLVVPIWVGLLLPQETGRWRARVFEDRLPKEWLPGPGERLSLVVRLARGSSEKTGIDLKGAEKDISVTCFLK